MNHLQAANQKRHVLSLVKKHGLAGAMRILGEDSPSLHHLRNQAIEAGIPIAGRGRPPVYAKDKIVKLLAKYGHKAGCFTKVRDLLASKGKPCPTDPMLVTWAKEAGITIKRGRPTLETV